MRKPYDPFLRVLVKRPGLPLRAEVVENTLRSMQELVDGPIECVTVTEDLAIVCNEEGRIRSLSSSASILRMQFVGPVAFVGVRGEEFMSITRKGERLVQNGAQVGGGRAGGRIGGHLCPRIQHFIVYRDRFHVIPQFVPLK